MVSDPRREPSPAPSGPPVLRVAQLVFAVRERLEDELPDVWVEGEVIEARTASTGYLYFTLVDGGPDEGARRGRPPPAQLKCVVFATEREGLATEVAAGARVRVRGKVSVYAAQSSLQLHVTHAVAAGEGERAALREKLKARLRKEGLFDVARKRELPRLPRVVGLVTSKHGAAFHDVVSVARPRFPVRIVYAHCKVQGPDAPRSIVSGLEALARVPGLDVVIVARGGGASEDLSAFDDERVVRAVAAFPVPVVSGVGHEVDVTLVDLVADVRAATPSNAAERVIPDRRALRGDLRLLLRRLQARFDSYVQGRRLALERVSARLAGRRGALRARRDQLRVTERIVERAQKRRISSARRALSMVAERLAASDPRRALSRARGELGRLSPRTATAMRARIADARADRALSGERLARAVRARIAGQRHALAVLAGRLHSLSPLAVLSRGYAIALDPSGHAVTRASDLSVGDRIEVRVEHGTIGARVEHTGSE